MMEAKAIDETKTLEATRNFFKDGLEHLCRSAGIRKSDLPDHIVNVVPDERISREINLVCLSINSCEVSDHQPTKQILIDRYIKGLAIREIALKIGFAESTTKRKVKVALLEFAERSLALKKAYNVDSFPPLLITNDTRMN